MKQTEAVIRVLEKLGGRGELKDIIRLALAMPGVDWSKAKQPQANIRRIVRETTDSIRPIGKGKYELLSYRNEIEQRDLQIARQAEEIRRLQAIPKEKDFLDLIVKEIAAKYLFEDERKKADAVRVILLNLGKDEHARMIWDLLNPKAPAPQSSTFINNGIVTGSVANLQQNHLHMDKPDSQQ